MVRRMMTSQRVEKATQRSGDTRGVTAFLWCCWWSP